jgi:very-short-patch-repair endonuclease
VECQHCKTTKWILEENITKNHGTVCNSCGDGIKYPEKFMMELLKELKIKYIFQYSPKWIKPKKYDFYIPSIKLIIEMDGGLGHGSKDNNMNGMTKEESKAKDDYKDELAKLHNIKIIRINCDYNDTDVRFEFIKQNTINKLRNVFNLNNINWNKCDLFAGKSSLLLEVCKLKKENPKLSPNDIVKIMGNISISPVSSYLKFGDKHGLCIYKPKEEHLISNRVNAQKYKYITSKVIICLDDEKIFYSVMDCDRQSEKLYNKHLDFRNISAVCNNKRNHTGNKHFKFISDLTPEEYIKYDIDNKLKELHNNELVQAC